MNRNPGKAKTPATSSLRSAEQCAAVLSHGSQDDLSQNWGSPRFPLKGSLKGDIDIGIGIDVDIDIDSDMAALISLRPEKEVYKAP